MKSTLIYILINLGILNSLGSVKRLSIIDTLELEDKSIWMDSSQLEAEFDSYFRAASNSKNYFIIRNNDLEILKNLLISLQKNCSKTGILEESNGINTSVKDSVVFEKKINQNFDNKENSYFFSPELQFFNFMIISIISLLFFYLFKYHSNKQKNRYLENMVLEIENNLVTCKRKSIEKERKYKRELIDGHLKISDLEEKLKKGNH